MCFAFLSSPCTKTLTIYVSRQNNCMMLRFLLFLGDTTSGSIHEKPKIQRKQSPHQKEITSHVNKKVCWGKTPINGFASKQLLFCTQSYVRHESLSLLNSRFLLRERQNFSVVKSLIDQCYSLTMPFQITCTTLKLAVNSLSPVEISKLVLIVFTLL